MSDASRPRRLVLVLGDQLDHRSAAFDDFDEAKDAVWMAEVNEEATHVWCHKLRLVVFFSAMRHFRDEARERGRVVHYHELTRDGRRDSGRSFAEVLAADVRRLRPESLVVLEPGDWRVQEQLRAAAEDLDLELDIRPDRHFLCSREQFDDWAAGRKSLVLEHFYRWMRREHGILVNDQGEPEGDRWNFDEDNRESFGREGPGEVPRPRGFRPDDVTRAVMEMVEARFGDHPGSLEHFDLPVTRREALAALRDFIAHRLPTFGPYEDAMWTGEPLLYHSRLSVPLNLHLISPRDCLERTLAAYADGAAPLASVEGFVRQILGWREFVRGIYWRFMPDYADRNALRTGDRDVPAFFWDGETDMNCVREVMGQVIDHGYAHHIQRLMVLGLYALLLGVHPRKFHEWHMAMYLDAIDWVSLPNALGMSQYGDGGIIGTKPYCASGRYIQRMSNYCQDCRYRPDRATGDDACPFTTLNWDFLDRHEKQFRDNPRMSMQVRNLRSPKRQETMPEIRTRARRLREAAPSD